MFSSYALLVPGTNPGSCVKDLLAATQWALSNDEVRIVVQTGEGKFFTTGMSSQVSTSDDKVADCKASIGTQTAAYLHIMMGSRLDSVQHAVDEV